MKSRHLILQATALLLAACESGSGGGTSPAPPPPPPPPAEVTGNFKAGNASGVSWATPTRSGKTDAAGTFKYLPGEMVTFSVGGIPLGSATGAATITPFTLAGLSAPDTEITLRRELDLSRRIATPFTRAVNIQRLLIALDADHDPANGLDVTSANGTLAGASLSLDGSLPDFSARLDRLAPGLTQNVPLSRAVVMAYRAAQITLQVHVEARRDVPGGMVWITTHAADGAIDSQGVDMDGDGAADDPTRWTYDGLGRVATRGTAGAMEIFTYDPDGALVSRVAPGTRYGQSIIRTRAFTSDDYGFPLDETVTEQVVSNGNSQVTNQSTWGYDPRHNVSSLDVRDLVNGPRRTETTSFDSNDRVLESTVIETLLPTSERVDQRTTHTTIDYEAATRTATTSGSVSGAETDYSGTRPYAWDFVTTRIRDAAGNETSSLEQIVGSPDHVLTTSTWDDKKRLLSREVSDTRFEPDRLDKTTTVFDAIGNPQTITPTSNGVTGQVTEFEYGVDGDLRVKRMGANVETTTPEVIADGVLALAQQYLDGPI